MLKRWERYLFDPKYENQYYFQNGKKNYMLFVRVWEYLLENLPMKPSLISILSEVNVILVDPLSVLLVSLWLSQTLISVETFFSVIPLASIKRCSSVQLGWLARRWVCRLSSSSDEWLRGWRIHSHIGDMAGRHCAWS